MFNIDSYIESYIKLEKDIEHNLNSWKNGSKNILLITGLSGSGKSTKAAKLAKEYNAVNFELDLFEHNNILFNSNLKHDEANLIMKDIFEKTYGGKKDFDNCSDDQFRKEFIKFFKKLLAYCESNKDKKFIMEGLQISKHIASTDVRIIENLPIIINGASLATSIVRRFKRDYNCSDGSFKHPIKLIKKYLEWEESLNNLRNQDYLKKSIVKEDSINENIIIDAYKNKLIGKTVYHVSDKKVVNDQYLQPVSLSLGNKVENPNWCLFGWTDKDNAYGMIVSRIVKQILKSNGIKDYYWSKSHQLEVSQEAFNFIMNECDEKYIKESSQYLYYIKITEDMNIGIGHSSSTDKCVTIKNLDIPFYKIEKVNINKSHIKKYVKVCTKEYITKRKTMIIDDINSRGLMSVLYDKDSTVMINLNKEAMGKIKDDIKSGELLPGDDLTDYFDNFKTLSIKDRLFSIANIKLYNSLLKKSISESAGDNERKAILNRAEKAVLSVYNKFAVDKKSKEDFINGNKGKWNANTICLGGYPKDKYNEIFKALKDEFKGDNNVRIHKDNYFTIFLNINRNSKLFIKENTLLEAYKEHINPVYIITSYTGTIFGKLIKKATDSVYTHSAISFEPTLARMYSYGNSGNMSDSKLGGMTCESLKDYIKTNKDAKILVSVIFLKDRDFRKLETYFDNYINNVKNTTYDYSNLINILKNKALPNDHSLSSVCSQFVDSLFKWVGADITDKPSNLVTPQDIADIRHPRVYKLYEGLAIKYNSVYVSILVDKLQKYNGMPIKETCKDLTTARKFVSDVNKLAKKYDANYFIVTDGASGINNTGNPAVSNARDAHKKWEKSHKFDPDEDWGESIKEAKEFPVQFNNEGDLLIKKKEKIDFQSECNKSKKLRSNYVKYNNLEGLKYECCKLWYMNVILLKLLDNKNLSDSDREDLNLYRSKVLTEFPLYLKEIQKIDKNFNFSSYYDNTPFSNTKVKIKGSTIKYSLDLLRKIFI